MCCLSSFSCKVRSVPCGTMHSSFTMARMPWGCDSIRSSTSWLSKSARSASSTCTPSTAFSSCAEAKTASLKRFCSFSFVKLMHSCSRELCSNISNPKTSKMPTKNLAAPPPIPPPVGCPSASDSFTRDTSQSKRREYMALTIPSRMYPACSTLEGVSMKSRPARILRFVSANSRPASSADSMDATFFSSVGCITSESASSCAPKEMLPSSSSAPIIFQVESRSVEVKPAAASASSVDSYIEASEDCPVPLLSSE
mmetsp:Transcript_20102/g.51187  ORF Transcript_20102/g.51187 Transcript_20102/m.51187 type:complete len:255 (+) Transcript_20102:3582-4346(+)